MKKAIGIIILVSVFAWLFYETVLASSWKMALINWGAAIILAALVIGAVYLIWGNKQ